VHFLTVCNLDQICALTEKKKNESCHWGFTFSKGKLLSILGPNMYILAANMYILSVNMYILC